MADQKLSELFVSSPLPTNIAVTDLLYVVRNNVSYAATGDKINAGGGAGNVVGPASSNAGTFALFDGVTGKLIKEGGTPSNSATIDTTNASNIDKGTLDGDRLPAISATKKGGVPAVPNAAGKFLRDDGTWQTIGGGGDLLAANNLSDLSNITVARVNLGLGNGATRNVGTTAGTLAAGDDSRVVAGGTALQPNGNGSALTGLTSSQVGLGNVTNDAQTKASVVPNTLPNAGQIHVGNANAFQVVSISGDATLASNGAITVANAAITNAKMANVNTATFKARKSSNAGAPEDLNILDAQQLINPYTFNDQTTSYTVQLSDIGKVVRITNANATVITIPNYNTNAFGLGVSILVKQNGAGTVSISGGVGVTVNSRGTALKLAGLGAGATVINEAQDVWWILGDITT